MNRIMLATILLCLVGLFYTACKDNNDMVTNNLEYDDAIAWGNYDITDDYNYDYLPPGIQLDYSPTPFIENISN